VNARRVYGPETPNPSGVHTAPDDLVGWFEDHPYLGVKNLRTGKVGDVSGPTFDVIVPPLPRDYSSSCGESCVPVFFVSDGGDVWLSEGFMYRVSIVHVENKTIVTIVQGRADSFDAFLPRAESVLRTVEWDPAPKQTR
jgi:hypothetical protein